jgi:uncharacterized protein DUF397
MTEELGEYERVVAVRDSKNPDGTKLFFRPHAWTDLLDRIKAGELDPSEEDIDKHVEPRFRAHLKKQ